MRAEVIKKVIVKEETEIIVDSIDIPSVEDLKDIPSSFLSIGGVLVVVNACCLKVQ